MLCNQMERSSELKLSPFVLSSFGTDGRVVRVCEAGVDALNGGGWWIKEF